MPIRSTKRQADHYYGHGFDQSMSPFRENTAVRESDRDVRTAERGWSTQEQPMRRSPNPAPSSPPSGGGGGKKPPKGPTGYGDNDDRKNINEMYKNKKYKQ